MVFFCFGVVAYEDVCSYSAVGDYALYGCHTVQIPFASIFSVHQFQDAVGTTLYRQVDMFADIRVFCYYLQRLVTHILRM